MVYIINPLKLSVYNPKVSSAPSAVSSIYGSFGFMSVAKKNCFKFFDALASGG
jgi:hypothetical protein